MCRAYLVSLSSHSCELGDSPSEDSDDDSNSDDSESGDSDINFSQTPDSDNMANYNTTPEFENTPDCNPTLDFDLAAPLNTYPTTNNHIQVPDDDDLVEDDCLLEKNGPFKDNTGGALASFIPMEANPTEPEAPGIGCDNPEDDLPELRCHATEHRHQVEYIVVESGDGAKPRVTIRYTERHRKSRAGCIIKHSASYDERYASTINYNTNVWSPFNSKLDWDLARWAKMRGPGSNSLNELLSIEGVSFYLT